MAQLERHLDANAFRHHSGRAALLAEFKMAAAKGAFLYPRPRHYLLRFPRIGVLLFFEALDGVGILDGFPGALAFERVVSRPMERASTLVSVVSE